MRLLITLIILPSLLQYTGEGTMLFGFYDAAELLKAAWAPC